MHCGSRIAHSIEHRPHNRKVVRSSPSPVVSNTQWTCVTVSCPNLSTGERLVQQRTQEDGPYLTLPSHIKRQKILILLSKEIFTESYLLQKAKWRSPRFFLCRQGTHAENLYLGRLDTIHIKVVSPEVVMYGCSSNNDSQQYSCKRWQLKGRNKINKKLKDIQMQS